jgi:hypothetical protein
MAKRITELRKLPASHAPTFKASGMTAAPVLDHASIALPQGSFPNFCANVSLTMGPQSLLLYVKLKTLPYFLCSISFLSSGYYLPTFCIN